MMANGTLIADSTPGIYRVLKLTDLPFQIVIGEELEGEEYAAYRVLTDHANKEDVKIVAEHIKMAKTPEEQELGQRLMEFIEEKNPGITREIIGGEKEMASILMTVLKPEIDEQIDTAVATARADERRTNLYTYVQDGAMNIDYAARKSHMSADEFSAAMRDAGFTVPKSTVSL